MTNLYQPLTIFKKQAHKADHNNHAARNLLPLRKAYMARSEPVSERCIRFVISTQDIDRSGDTVALSGWELDAYKSNPVVLWGHDPDSLPIGKCVNIGIDGGALKAVVQFVPSDMPHIGEKAEAIYRLCQEGYLSATSVGFRPLEWAVAAERTLDEWEPAMDFTRQELMEFSIVSVPCNPFCLLEPQPAAPTPDPPDAINNAGRARRRKTAAEIRALLLF